MEAFQDGKSTRLNSSQTWALPIFVKPDALEALVASLPTAHHKKMSNVGHAPYCENSSEFNQILDSFIITCSNR